MEKYVLSIYSFVIVVALTGFFTHTFFDAADAALITSNLVKQKTQGVLVSKTQPQQSYTPQQKKATTGLIIKDGTPYIIMTDTTGLGTTMEGMINIGIPVATTTLQEHCITLSSDGKLHTPHGAPVQIKDSELRRKPIKLTFGGKKNC